MVIMRILLIALSKLDYFGYPQGIIHPTYVDSTGKLFELLASAFRNAIKGITLKMWWPNI